MHPLLSELDDQQRAAVERAGGPMVVLAGPGSGKTRVITRRVAWMVDADGRGIDPERVLAVTFTVKAAEELRGRLGDLLGAGLAERVRATNFHRFGLGLVQRFADVLGLPREPVIIDSAQRKRTLRELSRERGLLSWSAATGRDAAVDAAASFIESMAHEGLDASACAERVRELSDTLDAGGLDDEQAAGEREKLARAREWAELYGAFGAHCRERGWITLDDLILLPIELLRDDAMAASIVRGETRHVVVDEFQDVNRAQIELLRLLAPPESEPDLCVVGDDDQSIYEFRGADDRAFERFAQIWPSNATFTLETNYRSRAGVVDVTREVIARATHRFEPDKRMRAHAASGGVVECVSHAGNHDDGEAIAAWIKLDRARHAGRAWSDYAVIAHAHGDLDRIGAALRLEEVPTLRSRRSAPTDDAAVQDLLAWIELIADTEAVWSARRLLTRPPSGASVTDLAAWERRYRALRSRHDKGEAGAEDPGAYVAWLSREAPGDASVARFVETLERVRTIAAQHGAGEAVRRIVLETGLAHADLASDRARRVAAVVAAMNWAQETESRLEAPRDVAALWRHYQDLSPSDQELRSSQHDRVNGGNAEELDGGDEGDGVRLLTAHASKGLEFPVVLVPRAQAQFGYGQVRDGGSELPAGLLDRAGDERSRKERLLAERRRLFYVACTRAEETLVVLAKRNKKRSSGTHFFEELVHDAPTSAMVSAREGEDVLSAARAAGALTRGVEAALDPASVDGAGRAAALRSARAAARLAAASALDLCERAGEVDVVERAAEMLGDEARRMAIAATIARTGEAPAWALDGPMGEFARGLAATSDGGAGAVVRPRRKALRLSYTTIHAYQKCPACYYVVHELGLSSAPTPALSVGVVVHEALQRFAEAWRGAESEGVAAPGLDALLELGRAAYWAAIGPNGEASEDALERVEGLLRVYFESLHDPSAQVLEVELAVATPYERDGLTHVIGGRLDRLDRIEGGVRLIDYKTGAARKDLIEPKKSDLQLGLYALALEHAFPDSGGLAEYWVLSTGQRGAIALEAIDLSKTGATVDAAIDGILGGRFERAKGCAGACSLLAGASTDGVGSR